MKRLKNTFIPSNHSAFSDIKRPIPGSKSIDKKQKIYKNYPIDFESQNYLMSNAKDSSKFRKELINSQLYRNPIPQRSSAVRTQGPREYLKPVWKENLENSTSSFKKTIEIPSIVDNSLVFNPFKSSSDSFKCIENNDIFSFDVSEKKSRAFNQKEVQSCKSFSSNSEKFEFRSPFKTISELISKSKEKNPQKTVLQLFTADEKIPSRVFVTKNPTFFISPFSEYAKHSYEENKFSSTIDKNLDGENENFWKSKVLIASETVLDQRISKSSLFSGEFISKSFLESRSIKNGIFQ